MADLMNAERETHLNMAADDRSQWEVFSDDPVMLRKLESIGADCVGTVGEGKRFLLHRSQVIIRRRPVETKKQRAARIANFGISTEKTPGAVGVK